MLPSSTRILCVDDEKDSCDLINLMLKLADETYNITAVLSAEEALKLIAETPFDLYILDYRLPEMSGIELCRAIRQNDTDTPIMFFSAMAHQREKKKAMESGATEYLVKPDDLDGFTDAVARLLNKG